jgi:hypothetical protein
MRPSFPGLTFAQTSQPELTMVKRMREIPNRKKVASKEDCLVVGRKFLSSAKRIVPGLLGEEISRRAQEISVKFIE